MATGVYLILRYGRFSESFRGQPLYLRQFWALYVCRTWSSDSYRDVRCVGVATCTISERQTFAVRVRSVPKGVGICPPLDFVLGLINAYKWHFVALIGAFLRKLEQSSNQKPSHWTTNLVAWLYPWLNFKVTVSSIMHKIFWYLNNLQKSNKIDVTGKKLCFFVIEVDMS